MDNIIADIKKRQIEKGLQVNYTHPIHGKGSVVCGNEKLKAEKIIKLTNSGCTIIK
jgi:hypothetical protein